MLILTALPDSTIAPGPKKRNVECGNDMSFCGRECLGSMGSREVGKLGEKDRKGESDRDSGDGLAVDELGGIMFHWFLL